MKSNHLFFYFSFFLFLSSGFPLLAAQEDAPRSPNVIVIMCDDMGWSDIAPYGGEIDTPNLDRLAENGLRFTQFYNTGRCCPTRASLMTGLYPHQAGIGHMMNDKGHDGYRGDLNRTSVTIPEVLKTAGYATYMSGKWHVTKHTKPQGPKDNWPRQRGYDRFMGTIHGAGSFFDPNSLTLDNTQVPPSAIVGDETFYYTDVINDFAADCIRDHHDTAPEQPFFLYVAHTAPHWPMHALPQDIAKYKGKYDKGWDAMRKARHKRQLEMGLVDPKWPMSPRDEKAPAWKDAERKEWEISRMEVFAAMVDNVDQGIGRIIDALEATDQFDDTLIFFLADNGGCAELYGARPGSEPTPPQQLEPMAPGELQFDMTPHKTRDGKIVREGVGVIPGPADTALGYGLGWANASNTPFREYKHWVHEGGIATPLIAHWPNGIAADRNGKLDDTPAHLIDIMATCVDLADAKYPRVFHEEKKQIQPMEGLSLAPAFKNQSKQITDNREALYWEHEGNRAIRIGDMKLVAKGRNGPWELYDLSKDRTELNNLAEEMPEKVEQMAAQWTNYATRTNVLPWPGTGKKK
ncbi:MAG: arylsulfatase [Verrucomicrobiota bacterium]